MTPGRFLASRLARFTACAVLACAGLAGAPALAADRVIGPSGVLHSISVETNTIFGTLETKLVYRVQMPAEESVQSMVIPGTDEPVADSEPTILLSPLTYRPVIAWTRNVNTESEITCSFYNGSQWSTPLSLTQNGSVDRHPQLFWGRSGYLHIVWTGAVSIDGPLMYEAVLDSKGVVVLPPALVRTTPGAIITTNSAGSATLNPTDTLFLVDTSYKNTGRVTAQGGYDEPIPVNRRTDFLLPSGCTVESSKIQVVNGRILVMVKSGSRLFYSYESAAGWTPLRNVGLDSSTDERAAEIMVTGMLEGLAAP